MIKDIFIDTFRGDAIHKCIGLASWFLLAITLACLVYVLDSSFAHTERQMVKIADKEFVPAHTTFISQVVGKSTVLTPIHHADSWYVTVVNGSKRSRCQVGIGAFSEAKSGESAYAYVGSGLISNQEYCEKFQPITN